MQVSRWIGFSLAGISLALAACAAPAATTPAGPAAQAPGPASVAGAASAQSQTLRVEMGDWFYEPASWTVRSGPVNVTLVNNSVERRHTFVIRNPAGGDHLADSGEVEAGQTGTLTFTLSTPGTYEVFCS